MILVNVNEWEPADGHQETMLGRWDGIRATYYIEADARRRRMFYSQLEWATPARHLCVLQSTTISPLTTRGRTVWANHARALAYDCSMIEVGNEWMDRRIAPKKGESPDGFLPDGLRFVTVREAMAAHVPIAKAIRAANPKCKIVSGGDLNGDAARLEQFCLAGLDGDFYGHHPYLFADDPWGFFKGPYREMRKVLERLRPNMRMAVTEVGSRKWAPELVEAWRSLGKENQCYIVGLYKSYSGGVPGHPDDDFVIPELSFPKASPAIGATS